MNLYIKNSKYFILNTFYTRNSPKKMTDWTDWLTMTQTQTDSVYRLKDQHTYALQATSDFLQTLVLAKTG